MKNLEPMQRAAKKAAPKSAAPAKPSNSEKPGSAKARQSKQSAPAKARQSKQSAPATAAADAAQTVSDPRLTAAQRAFASDKQVTFGGKGFGSSALKRSGKIFAMLDAKGGFVVKLSKARVEELVRAGTGSYFDPGHGRLMKEWLALGATPAPATWLELAKEAHRHLKGQQD